MEAKVSNYAICRIVVAFVWIYHGLVPKLLGPHPDETAMNMALGISEARAAQLSIVAGVIEIGFGVMIILLWRSRWPLLLTVWSMVGLLVFSLYVYPGLASAAFNPVTTNVAVLALAVVAYSLHGEPDGIK